MKKFGVLVFMVLFVVFNSFSQQKKYISYTVKVGETMKSIAKDNNMKQKDLLRLNPDVAKKPKANTVIIIPNRAFVEGVVDSEGLHTVQRKETLFSIAQKYGVTVEAIKKVNNLTGDYLSTGRIIRIPDASEVEKMIVEEEIDPNAIMHLVVKDDTVYNITKKYSITEEELYGMNPALEDGLKLGMNLKVGEKEDERELEDLNLFVDEVTNKPLNVLLMLPYKLKSFDFEDEEFEWDNRLLNIVTDFHSGALVALDSLRAQGMNVSLDVVDTENNAGKVSTIANSYDFDEVDAIVGPLFMNKAKQVSKTLNDVPVIAPIYSKSQASISDNNLIKVAPNKELLEAKIEQHLVATYTNEKVIIVGDNSNASAIRINRVKELLSTHDSIGEITIIKPIGGYIAKDRFIEVIDTIQKKNWVILLSDDNIVTNDAVNNLGTLPLENREIQMFAPQKGNNYKDVMNEHLARLNFTYASTEFNNVASSAYANFQGMYRQKYHVRPSDYAKRGFDVMYDTLLRLSSGEDFNEGATLGVSERVLTKFDYKKRLFGSTENKGIYLLQYQSDLSLIELN
ncbi:LysM peptidoglycan-binding domain-containing protein [Urechidicola vernalis]|uniref:LysM peptidoglycan-binding domain-containing protein n=1 Tax=Urechidicola vernalis TaxID=3075600 RepID=A0ABU2Y3Q1_9FLAO|nr:LysM peptidoglycan-binding domain-containing protein [Urechidicola sp. P050]MDT0552796.1 LysM peptidoglycan-binding domain-containing protein [Urechidicola sp. P050]